MSILATKIERLADPAEGLAICPRCGIVTPGGARDGRAVCRDCKFTLHIEERVATYGLDITDLTDEDWDRLWRVADTDRKVGNGRILPHLKRICERLQRECGII